MSLPPHQEPQKGPDRFRQFARLPEEPEPNTDRARPVPRPLEELEVAADRVLSFLGSTPQLHALFKYLWEHQERHAGLTELWEKGGLKELCRSKSKNDKGFAFDQNVRTALGELRIRLRNYFANHSDESWRIELPDADPGLGYRLANIRVSIDFKTTGAFWQPHLQGEHPVSVIYVEHTFYHDPERGFVFRYYDCNEEHSEMAMDELSRLHLDSANKRLKVIYPYVAKGEAQALHLLGKWFAKFAAIQIEPVTTRNLHRDDLPEDDSVILFGSAASNRFIRDLLDRHDDVPMTLLNRTHARLLSPTAAERQRIVALEKGGYCRVDDKGDECMIEFADDKSWPGILTRLPNPHTSVTPATVFNSDFGTAVQALADFLTDENRLPKGMQSLGISHTLSDYFQFLYCVDAVRRDAKPRIQPIAWRAYTPVGI